MTLYYYEDAVISYVIEQWKNITNNRLGRTIVQKLCYFIKYEGVSLDFRFRLHHFGPFSQKLFLRMDELKSDDVIKDALDEPERSAYEIGDNALEVMNHFSKDLGAVKPRIDEVINKLSCFISPEELELLATIHYFYYARYKFNKKAPSKEEIVQETKDVKNKFSKSKIEETYDQLVEKGFLRTSQALLKH